MIFSLIAFICLALLVGVAAWSDVQAQRRSYRRAARPGLGLPAGHWRRRARQGGR